MGRHSSICALILGCIGCGAAPGPATTPAPATAAPVAQAAPVLPPIESVADSGFIDAYAATGGFRLGQPAGIEVTPNGDAVLFLRSGPRAFSRNLYSFDVATGEESVLLTAEQILQGAAEQLSAEERARRERLRMSARGIARYELSEDGQKILVPLSGRLYVVDRASREVSELPNEGAYANDPHFSPDASSVACVRDGDLYLIDVARGRQRRLTRSATEHLKNGLAEFVAQEEMGRYRGYWWAPDGASLLYQETNTEEVETLFAGNPIAPEQEPEGAPYPRAGRTNATVRLGVISARGGRTRWLEWDSEGFPYVTTVRWNGSGLYVLVQNRRQTEEKLLRVNVATGATEVLLTETDAAWLNLDQDVPAFVGDDGSFLWSTERDGAFQLELRGPDGARVREVTTAAQGYRSIAKLDGEAGIVWFTGGGDPTETQLFQVPLAGGDATQISVGAGAHRAVFGDDANVWVQMSHTLERGPTWLVRRGTEVVGELSSVAEAPPFVPEVEHLTVGERDYRALIVRPRNFDEARRYPVLLSVYAGPGHPKVSKGRYRQLRDQWLADHGFVIVSVDGRGTPYRGREWERAIQGNLIALPLEDQIAGLRAVAERYEQLDLERVGVYGWSFGGYFSAHAVMQHPELFRAGVAGAPVGDWRDYDTHYTERFMGLPSENQAGYDASSVLTYAPRLERPLMIIHGTSDDNVYFVHALRMSDALLRNGRSHQFIPLSGSTHMVADPDVARSLQSQIVAFFREHLAE